MSSESANHPSPPIAIDRTVAALRRRVGLWRDARESVALVPTMGALHDGHIALVEAARDRARHAIVSIFVNPRQFAPHEDFDAYPRREAEDLALLAQAGAAAVFMPSAGEMYPAGDATAVAVGGPALGLESDSRPHFFGGVATVVTKLLLAALPDFAIFGEKDYQQLAVIRRMARDLLIPVEIVGHPTVREADGLAFSSRNAYLTAEERRIAPLIHRTLKSVAADIAASGDPAGSLAAGRRSLSDAGFRVDYLELRNAETLSPVTDPASEPLRLLAAAWLGKTRLIDNIAA
jgi:pantoate--beta-alanine ligase